MIKFERGIDTPDTEKYEQHIRYNGRIYYSKDELEPLRDYNRTRRDSLDIYACDVMKRRSGGKYRILNRDSIYAYLTEFEKCPKHYFNIRGVQSFSLDASKVLGVLRENGYAKEFLDLYLEYVSVKSLCSSANTLLDIVSDPVAKNKDGVDLYPLNYSVKVQTNLRYNYNHFDIISQVPKDYVPIIKAPEGYCLVWGDFAQSDLRIAYSLLLQDENNIKIMESVEDKYEGIARILAEYSHEPFDPKKFAEERDIYKLHTLQTIYGTRGTQEIASKHFIDVFSKYLLNSCPKYSLYLERLNRRFDMNLPIITTSYFGYEESVPNIRQNREATLNFALNSPIQSGTSEIIIMTCNKILERFFDLGYTEDDISIYMVRHDEPVFLVKEEVLKDAWVFADSSVIQIDDWIPLRLDFEAGYSYSVADDALCEQLKDNAKANSFRMHNYNKSGNSSDYYPVDKVSELFFHYVTVDNFTIAAILSNDRQALDFVKINSNDPKEIESTIVSFIYGLSEKLKALGESGLLIHNNFISGSVYHSGNLIKFVKEAGVSLYDSQVSCEYAMNKIAEKQGKELPFRYADMGDLLSWGSLSKVLEDEKNEKYK